MPPDPVAVIDWFTTSARDLPWRKTNPWGVMVSEFMLQQTPVNRVLPAWETWMQVWPSPAKLAQATPADAIRLWANLGYPRRAIRLHATSVVLTEQYNNEVPHIYEQLIALPGVGDYTANAILAFAFNQPTVVVDINVRRVLARAWLGNAHPANSYSTMEKKLAQALVPTDPELAPRWAAASMELGALICTATNPACMQCPIQKNCAWFTSGQPDNASKPRSQAKYEGSDRQERGRILRELRQAHSPIAIDDLQANTSDLDQFQRALISLINDSMIVDVTPGFVSLPER